MWRVARGKMKRIAIVGGGISGLAAAFALENAAGRRGVGVCGFRICPASAVYWSPSKWMLPD